MTPSAPIVGVASRIADIRARLDPRGAAGHPLMTAAAPIVAPRPVDFEPFGDVYQEALSAVRAQPAGDRVGAYRLDGGDRALLQSWSPASPFAPSAPSMGVGGAHGGGCTHCAALSSVGPMGPTIDPYAVPTGASVGKIGGYGRLDAPAELKAYGNGRVPQHALEPIGQGGHRLYAPAARAWQGLVEAAAADGVDMKITDSYRSYDQQVDLVRRKGLYSEGGLGATPGTSNHGWGLAVDANVNDPRTLEWIRTNGWRFGFVEAVPREPWHWEFRPHQA